MNELWWRRWVGQWATDINTATGTMSETFAARYGFAPGINQAFLADDGGRQVAGRFGRDSLAVEAMATFYDVVAQVSLPDVGNGYFIHPADDVLRLLEETGYVSIPLADEPRGIAIGSDGGGLQFVMDAGGGVHRSATATLDGDFEKVAETVEEFLDLLRDIVDRFVDTGSAVDLRHGRTENSAAVTARELS